MRRRITACIALTACVTALVLASSAGAARYVIVYQHQAVPADAAERIERAGGRLLAEYDAIGVAIAESDDELFRRGLLRDRRVAAAASTEPVGEGEGDGGAESMGPPPGDLPNAPATDGDTFSGMQWNMRKIKAPEAHAITGGSPRVVVGVIDTGLDATHPDLDGNVDAANSVSCVGGVPNQSPAAWDDDSGHGTHVAGLIAAESNGIGIVGVAPNVKVAAIKASLRIGPPGAARDIFRPEAVVCALMWAGSRHLDVANNSYSVDQDLITDALDFFCHNDREDQAYIKAIQRASHYASKQGVTLVAAAGNQMLDLANPPLGNDCIRMPAELPAFLTVSSTGTADELSAFSNYGVGVIDVAAPGGNIPPAPPAGFVLSTWPGKFFFNTLLCDPPVSSPCPMNAPGVAYYRFMAGTSQATAHVSGVAALVISRFGDSRTPHNGKLRPGRVEAMIEQTADPIPCPPEPTACEGGQTNGFYGHGRVNAFRAVTHETGG